jgi:hypothetical protein
VQASDGDDAEIRARVLQSLRRRLQEGLDRLQAELEPTIARYRRPNPFRGEAG